MGRGIQRRGGGGGGEKRNKENGKWSCINYGEWSTAIKFGPEFLPNRLGLCYKIPYQNIAITVVGSLTARCLCFEKCRKF